VPEKHTQKESTTTIALETMSGQLGIALRHAVRYTVVTASMESCRGVTAEYCWGYKHMEQLKLFAVYILPRISRDPTNWLILEKRS
jgi:hypothetical protein